MIPTRICRCAGAGAAVVALLLLLPAKGDAQNLPLELEGRLGGAIPTGEISEHGAGLSFGASVGYTLRPALTVFGGFTRNGFGKDGEGSMSTGGFDLGVRYAFAAPLNPWLRGGLVVHQWRETGFADSDHSLGFEVGAGASVPVTGMVSLTPGIRYTAFSPRWSGEALGHGAVGVVVIDVGARVSL